MDQVVSFSWAIGVMGIGVFLILLWRLYIAINAQQKLEESLAESRSTLEAERQDLGQLIQTQTETIKALTYENQTLKTQSELHLLSLTQLQSDHQALQEKYSELEQDLLTNIATRKTLSEDLQSHKLEKARLHRQVESAQQRHSQQTQEQESLRRQHQKVTDKNQLYQKAVEAAKIKIESLNQDKKRLERELQQALYQIVELEQTYNQNKHLYDSIEPSALIPSGNGMLEPILPKFG